MIAYPVTVLAIGRWHMNIARMVLWDGICKVLMLKGEINIGGTKRKRGCSEIIAL